MPLVFDEPERIARAEVHLADAERTPAAAPKRHRDLAGFVCGHANRDGVVAIRALEPLGEREERLQSADALLCARAKLDFDLVALERTVALEGNRETNPGRARAFEADDEEDRERGPEDSELRAPQRDSVRASAVRASRAD